MFTKNIRFLLTIFFLGSLAISLTTCAGSLALNGIVLAPANPSLPVGVTQQFTATGYYNDQTTHDITTQVTWTSSNPSVATIDSTTGVATAASAGTTTITATSTTPNSVSNQPSLGSTTLTVTPTTLSSIAVTPINPSIPVRAMQQFTATGTYNNGTTNNITTQVTWTSSNPSVAAIDSTGLAVAVSIGTTTITATSITNTSISGSTILTVNSATLLSLAVTPVNPSIPVGVPQKFTAIGTYSDTTSFPTQATWTSSDPTVATIDSTGLAVAVAIGTTTITATSIINASISGSTFLTVNTATLSSIAVTPASPKIFVGDTQQFKATGTYSDGTSFDITTQVTWTSSNPSVATVNSTGRATAVSAGTTTITATSITNTPGISGSATLTITPVSLYLISVTPANIAITRQSFMQFKATGTYVDGTSHDITTQVSWTSSDTTIATINSNGLATADLLIGRTTITATLGSISGSTTLTVQ